MFILPNYSIYTTQKETSAISTTIKDFQKREKSTLLINILHYYHSFPFNRLGGMEPLNLSIHRITMPDYEQHHYDKELLKQSAVNLGNIEIEPVSDLEQARNAINKYCDESSNFPKLSQEWCFVDCKYRWNYAEANVVQKRWWRFSYVCLILVHILLGLQPNLINED